MAAVIRRLITRELHEGSHNKSERRSPTAGSRWIKTMLCRQPSKLRMALVIGSW